MIQNIKDYDKTHQSHFSVWLNNLLLKQQLAIMQQHKQPPHKHTVCIKHKTQATVSTQIATQYRCSSSYL